MDKNLANLLRPKKMDDIVGQNHLKSLLREVIVNKLTYSFLFFGESGTGKTSTAFVLVNELGLKYGYFNSTINSKKDLIDILENCDAIIIDEIHRLNKDKQDILLSYLEFDKIIVYATTTENPYFKVVPAVRSRMQILQFHKISETEITQSLRNIINSHFNYLNISNDNLLNLARFSNGDLRASINNLQLLVLLKKDNKEITQEDLKVIIPNISFYSDMNQSAHYDNLSAFHKSLRGSDVNASLYYGFLILKTGDIDGLFRRMLCVAYEDIGMANPNVALRTHNAIQVFERLGLPEGELPIANAIIDLASSPKSNSVVISRDNIKLFLESGRIYQIPKHLKDSHYASAKKLGDGINYLYPHDYHKNWVSQQYLPKEIENEIFYFPQDNKLEKDIKNYWTKLKEEITKEK
ncbi:replication-associated recombination protein A [Mycoplasmopsis cynos]|nr:replication-associated recombination protein A [Mycoplasmopsis felis]WQQ11467.1 replication-associated recombination protein A [Mycoplasmopsis felis]